MNRSVLAIILLCAAAPLFAQERTVQWTVWVSQVEMQETAFDDGFETDFEDGNALGLSANLLLNRYVSVEGSVFGIRTDAALAFEDATIDLGTLDLVPFTLGAQFHLLGDSRFDPYVGAGAAYIVADDLSSADLDTLALGRIELENEVTYYVNAGVGVRIAGGFGIVLDGRYMPYEPTSRSTVTGVEQDLELSPRLLSLGFRLRF